MTSIIVPADKAWEFGMSEVFHGGRAEIARSERCYGIGISICIEGFHENSDNDFGFGISVDHIGVDPERRGIWWEYAHDKAQCEEIVGNIYLAFLGEEIRMPWTP